VSPLAPRAILLHDTGTYVNNERWSGRQQIISFRGLAKDRENDETALFVVDEGIDICMYY
jgi:hypothetical protein